MSACHRGPRSVGTATQEAGGLDARSQRLVKLGIAIGLSDGDRRDGVG
jgi:hypothetical protein